MQVQFYSEAGINYNTENHDVQQPAVMQTMPAVRQKQNVTGANLKGDDCLSVNVQLPLHTYYANSLSALYSLCPTHCIHTENNIE